MWQQFGEITRSANVDIFENELKICEIMKSANQIVTNY